MGDDDFGCEYAYCSKRGGWRLEAVAHTERYLHGEPMVERLIKYACSDHLPAIGTVLYSAHGRMGDLLVRIR